MYIFFNLHKKIFINIVFIKYFKKQLINVLCKYIDLMVLKLNK